MVVSLWALALAARYLKYLPIIGWRFSESIVQSIEARMDRDVGISEVTLELADEAPPTDLRVDITVENELPVDLSISAINLRIGYDESAETVANVVWSDDAYGNAPDNLSLSTVESGGEATVTVERYLVGDASGDELYVDGSLSTEAWVDGTSTRKVSLGTLRNELPKASAQLAS